MVKRAVVVGINDYSAQVHPTDLWPILSGCVRDAQAMRHLLVDGLGFDPSQVWLYTDHNATSSNIRRAIRNMLSVSDPGDVACFYFAGHGGIHDLTEDTFYQTIIPYSGRYITDWDLWAAAETLQPSHVNFTIILDSCHSGGMHEETEHLRAVRSIRYAREFIDRVLRNLRKLIPFGVTVPNVDAFKPNVSRVRIEGPLLCMDEDETQQFIPLAKSTAFTACAWSETAGETPSHGYFTQAFLDIVNQSDFRIDHRGMHRRLVDRVHQLGAEQNPQLRGQQNRMEEDFLTGWRDSR